MVKHVVIKALLWDFGNVLSDGFVQIPYADGLHGMLETCTLLCSPGSEIHAEPCCNGYRTVLFFSVCPDTSKSKLYDLDTQYSAPLSCGTIMAQLWGSLLQEDSKSSLIYLIKNGPNNQTGNFKMMRSFMKWNADK